MMPYAFFQTRQLQSLLDILQQDGYDCLGPVTHEGVIKFRTITDIGQFPRGYVNHQSPGHYQLQQQTGNRLFSWNHGPQGIKPLCFAADETLWHENRDSQGNIRFDENLPAVHATAIIGVRACDIAALNIQDQHFLQHPDRPDPQYQARREKLLLIAVDCTTSASTCFCASTGDGPDVHQTVDIALSEIRDGFLVRADTPAGQNILQQMQTTPATDEQLQQRDQAINTAVRQQQRRLPTHSKKLLDTDKQQHEHWQAIAERCLSCANCTAVCPTCFCYSTEHETGLDALTARQVRHWDSCFSSSHSSMAHFRVRPQTAQRYRQWLTHKLAGWQEQFGRSGCTGCGRCITWCPVGIDMTAEVARILDS